VTNSHITDYLNEIQSKISNNILHINRGLQKISNDKRIRALVLELHSKRHTQKQVQYYQQVQYYSAINESRDVQKFHGGIFSDMGARHPLTGQAYQPVHVLTPVP
jgi:transcription initiation factor TFIID subunit TAF12